MGVFGGTESMYFLKRDSKNLRTHVEKLLDKVPPPHLHPGQSERCPPGVSIEKFRLITEIMISHSGSLSHHVG